MLQKCVQEKTFHHISAWWINTIQHYALSVIAATALLTILTLIYIVTNFKFNTNLTDMISNDLPFRKNYKEFKKRFPLLDDTLVVVVHSQTPEGAYQASKALAQRFAQEKALFKTVYQPGAGKFFEKNGLLYLSVEQLEELFHNLARVQPLLAFLYHDPTLRGLFQVLEKAVNTNNDNTIKNERLISLFTNIGAACDSVIEGRPFQLSWQEIIHGSTKHMYRQFIVLQPNLDFNTFSPGEDSIKKVRSIAQSLNLKDDYGAEIRLTGSVALSRDELISVQQGIGNAAVVSFILVTMILFIGLGSGRLVLVSVITLIIGFIWTTGFALVYTEQLNLISVSFAVLFIGLAIDYSIQYCLRYRELIEQGHNHITALSTTVQSIGSSLLLCTITTSVGFYAFVPTAYSGAAELGIISGTGMIISFLTNITVLPALLKFIPYKKGNSLYLPIGETLYSLPYHHTKKIIVTAVLLGLGAAFFMPQVYFDYNPLNLADSSKESVIAAKELFDTSDSSPWTLSIMAHNRQEADNLTHKLRQLREVEKALTISDFVPHNQEEKLDVISDIALFLPDEIITENINKPSYEETVSALEGLESALKNYNDSFSENNAYRAQVDEYVITRLNRFKSHLDGSESSQFLLNSLDKALVSQLPALLDRLRYSVKAQKLDEYSLPKHLRERYVSSDGVYRIEVFPQEKLTDHNALVRFTSSVRALAPDATDAPVTILESGRAIVSAFKKAFITALIIISLIILVMLRSFSETFLILLPLALAFLLTGATTVLFDLPLNFANIIVIPLLLGIGVDYGIHLVLRFRKESHQQGNLLETSTARAILVSAFTTIVSFSSLAFSAHRGTASMGKLLAICIDFMIICTLLVLPALLKAYNEMIHNKI
jgi:hopanoid biosynthesis associated RND transporter like protein HpnN